MQYSHVSKLYAAAMRELKHPPRGCPLPWMPKVTQYLGGLRPHEVTLLCAPTGCISGDAMIRVNRAGKGFQVSMRDLYEKTREGSKRSYDLKIPTMVRAFDGKKIRLHRILEVLHAGIKEVWDLKLVDGSKLRATPTHPVLTENGFVKLWDLRPGMKVACDTHRAKSNGGRKLKYFDTHFQGLRHHPYARLLKSKREAPTKRIEQHRAIAEAKLNGLSIEEFLRTVRTDVVGAAKLKFVNPKTHHVHHINFNHDDDRPENLLVLTVKEHLNIHANYGNLGQGNVRWVEVESTLPIGCEVVYDIRCEDPHHNFCANDMVVHNTGKTELLATISAQLCLQGTPTFAAPVETGDVDFTSRVISTVTKQAINHGVPVEASVLDEIEKTKGNLIRSLPLFVANYDNRVAVEEIKTVLEAAHESDGVQVALLDNLNFFLQVVDANREKMEMDNAIHELVMFAKRVPIHTILIVHPRKTDDGRVTSEFDIKGSSTAVQECANIALFNRPTKEQLERGHQPSHRELVFKKIRKRGFYVNRPIWLAYEHGHYSEIADGTKRPSGSIGNGQQHLPYRDN